MAIISGKSIFGSPKSRSRRGSDANRTPESKLGLNHTAGGRKVSNTETISSQGSVQTTQHVLSADSTTSGNASLGSGGGGANGEHRHGLLTPPVSPLMAPMRGSGGAGGVGVGQKSSNTSRLGGLHFTSSSRNTSSDSLSGHAQGAAGPTISLSKPSHSASQRRSSSFSSYNRPHLQSPRVAYTTSPQYQGSAIPSTNDSLSKKPSKSKLELKRFLRPVRLHPQRKPAVGTSIHPHPDRRAFHHPRPVISTESNKSIQSTESKKSEERTGPSDQRRASLSQRSSIASTLSPEVSDFLRSDRAQNRDHHKIVGILQDDSILREKYGNLGKILGSGAGGSVKLVTRPSDNAIFAVKEFRPKKETESIRDYAKKCTAEFLIGSSLFHPNVVQTYDIFSNSLQDKFFEVMEYLPVDFFSVVMSDKMSRNEINCCFKQICTGVQYLHSMGLAHRDLKLDNCCMNEYGIVKLIDFGSTVVFRYPLSDEVTMAHGIVGSDPYLAPEVFVSTDWYDPSKADIWSIGIIYCCMMLKRFPWTVPREDKDENFRLYCMDDDVEHDYKASALKHAQLLRERRERMKRPGGPKAQEPKSSQGEAAAATTNTVGEASGTGSTQEKEGTVAEANTHKQTATEQVQQSTQGKEENESKSRETSEKQSNSNGNSTNQHKTVHGPYRLMRLLPHAARPIISKILQVDIDERATFEDIFNDDWMRDIHECTMDLEKNVIRRGAGHHHTVVKEVDGKETIYKI